MRIKQSDGRFHHAGAICHFPFVCTLVSGQPSCCLRCGINPFRACPYATKIISREPNTPLAFRRRDACHSKQQAGHGKISVGIGQDMEKPISRVADYDTRIFLITPQKNRSGLYVAFGAKHIKDTPSLPKRKIVTKAYGIIRQSIEQIHALTVGYDVDFVSPIFKSGLPCIIVKRSIGTKI